jgi:hypothetical protein
MSSAPRSARHFVALLAFVLGLGVVPHRVCERPAEAYFEGDRAEVARLAHGVEALARASRERPRPHAPASPSEAASARYDGEWRLVTDAMCAMGFGQMTPPDPARMEPCLAGLVEPGAADFDRDAWGAAPFDGDRGHAGYLGYAGLPLALHRWLDPRSRFTEDEERFVAALERRFVASPSGQVESYPGEIYPVDEAAGLAALALHAKATHASPSPGLVRGLESLRARGVDHATGLLYQSVPANQSVSGNPSVPGAPRGSGTALAVYFLAYADAPLAASLYRALREQLFRTVLGFGAVLEHPSGAWTSDVDSGPVVFGFGVSATGFAIGASRAQGDRDAFRALYATAHLFGAPYLAQAPGSGERRFETGGAIGNAILFAMLTSPRRPP